MHRNVSDLAGLMNSIRTLHSDIARDVYPRGGRLTCQVCGISRPFDVEDAAEYLAHGWPKHCDLSMRVEGA